MIKVSDIEYKADLLLDLYLPEGHEFDLFIYLHGGGLENGNRGGVDVFAKTLAKRGIATASVDYRLYPTAKYPEFLEDSADAVRWLFDHIAEYGRCRRFYLGGSSAGGYLSMMLCFDGRYLARVGLAPTDIAAYIHDAGQPTTHFNVLRERGLDTRRVVVDEAAPLFHVGAAERYSPMLFLVSDNDMAGRYEQTLLTVRTLRGFGHTEGIALSVEHGTHCHYTYAVDEDGEGVLAKRIITFLEGVEKTHEV
ncbi:MAG: alpha/beta hydrolase [Clostridia bacterium]|nr:alpha/beta hydrolase [Clostridia bacterium]